MRFRPAFAICLGVFSACGRIGFDSDDPEGPGVDGGGTDGARSDGAPAPQWRAEPSSTTNNLYTVASAGGDDIYAVGDGGVIVHRLASGEWITVASGTTNRLWSVWFAGENGWIVGDATTVLVWNGASWAPGATGGLLGRDLYDVSPVGGANAWAVGAGGLLAEYDGATWTRATTGTAEDLEGNWLDANGGIWVAGDAGTLLRDSGTVTSWTPIESLDLNAIYGSSPSDVYAVGSSGTVVHYDGASWSTVDAGTTADLNTVYAASANDVWAAGTNGSLSHFDGTSWTVTVIASVSLGGVYAVSPADVYVVGDGGVVMHYSP